MCMHTILHELVKHLISTRALSASQRQLQRYCLLPCRPAALRSCATLNVWSFIQCVWNGHQSGNNDFQSLHGWCCVYVCKFMCVHVYVCKLMWVHVYVCKFMCVHVMCMCASSCVYMCMCASSCGCMCMCASSCVYMCMYASSFMCVHVYVCKLMCVHVCVCVYCATQTDWTQLLK